MRLEATSTVMDAGFRRALVGFPLLGDEYRRTVGRAWAHIVAWTSKRERMSRRGESIGGFLRYGWSCRWKVRDEVKEVLEVRDALSDNYTVTRDSLVSAPARQY